MRFAVIAFVALGVLEAQSPSPHRLRADIRYLSSDLLEGRAAGTRGDTLAAEYIRTQFSQLGLKTSFQDVQFTGVETQPASRFGPFTWLTDFVGRTENQQPENAFQFADVVFVGYGIAAPEYQWDDYGTTTVRGKVVVVLAGEPPSDDPALFAGPARTPFAESSYKFAEAERRGAIAVLIVHTPEAAGLTWDAVRKQWGTEQFRPKTEERAGALQFAGWVTKAAAAKWLETDMDALIAQAGQRGFQSGRIEKRVAGRIITRFRTLSTRNVIAIAPGSDEAIGSEAVLYSAHLDHLGAIASTGPRSSSPDTIYNGAVDNATGLAVMLEIARLWMDYDPEPHRSAIFIATAAEEAGSSGAIAYVAKPIVPLAATKLALNLHAYLPLGRTRDFVLDGADRSPLWPLIRHTFERFGAEAKPAPATPTDPNAEPAIFARAGVPSFALKPGLDYSALPARKAVLADEFMAAKWRQPGDEFNEDWDLSGMEQTVQLGLELGLAVANSPAAK